MKKLIREEIIQKCNEIHNNKFDYSNLNYINFKTKVKIICPVHGEFEQLLNHHFRGRGCVKCANDKLYKTKDEFIENAKKIHGDKYDYSLVEYKNSSTKVKIICSIHDVFEQIPNNHLRGHICTGCSGKKKLTLQNFIIKSKKIHGDKYDYSLVDYKNINKKIKIICKKCDVIFEQIPNVHLSGCGCPKCNNSKGENRIELFLKNNKIKYIQQKTFENCKFKRKLPFDFYLPNYNTCIEYDGKQHMKPIKYFGGLTSFQKLKINDEIKNKYCIDNNINLIRINCYDNINNILKNNLKYVND